MKKYLPNFITCLNLFSGIIGSIAAYEEYYDWAFFCVLLSAVFDFLDGFMARALHVYSDIGKELDSLSDLVSFGLLPGTIAFTLLRPAIPIFEYIPYAGFLLTIFSALRLAKFNIDERQKESFIGLATPANALLWVSLAFSLQQLCNWEYAFLRDNYYVVLLLIVLFSYLLVAPLPMFSLKIHSLRWRGNEIRYIFLIGDVILFLIFRQHAVSLIIAWYILLSLGTVFFRRLKK